MKTFNISKRVSKQARQMCEHIIDIHDKYSKSYFWYPSPTSNGRRRSEERFATENPDVSFTKNNDEIRVSFEYKESCKNVYYHLHVSLYKNGNFIKDGNIKDIKKIIHV